MRIKGLLFYSTVGSRPTEPPVSLGSLEGASAGGGRWGSGAEDNAWGGHELRLGPQADCLLSSRGKSRLVTYSHAFAHALERTARSPNSEEVRG